ncbi:MAG: transglycosylase [Ideonella sp. MAG2]|nr:MAG: transglycosylase [Ideonella sp. MAG2]
MKISKAPAPRASKISIDMNHTLLRPQARLAPFSLAGLCLLCMALLAGCQWLPKAKAEPGRPPSAQPAPAPATAKLEWPAGLVERPRARWVPAAWGDLPGWGQDRASEVLPALRRSCVRPAEGWLMLCTQLRTQVLNDDVATRRWLEDSLRVYRVESLTGETQGLLTGYYEPLMNASRLPTDTRSVPLWAPPPDLASRRPYWTRQELESLPAAQAAVKGREIAYLEDPLDALVLQIQGSGRLRLQEPDGSERMVRIAYADHNGHPYRSVGRWLIEQGELKASEASWPGIKEWMRRNPQRLQEVMWQNPRMVFFREEPLPNPSIGPKGAQGVPLSPGRSVAVDPQSIPYGSLMWLDATEPLSTKPLQRLVVAQDTGSAIVGAVRADFFWGWGEEAEAQAGRTKQALRTWVLWPK